MPRSAKFILVHDLGTTSDKAALFDEKGKIIASVEYSYTTLDQPEGGYEQNPADWLEAICSATKKLTAKSSIDIKEIEAISVCGHMMGVVALDNAWRPLYPAIIHSDTRSRAQVKQIGERLSSSRIHQISGNPLDVHYPWAKIAWIKDNHPKVYQDTRLFVQSKDYVTSWLTGQTPVTDWSDASLYGCFDLHRLEFSDELCEVAGIDKGKLPQIAESGSLAGKLTEASAKAMGVPSGIPVYVGFGDGASAALGAGAWDTGSFYNYVGSTSWVAATTAEPVIDTEGRLFTLALTREKFNAIGTVQCAGSAWNWAVTRLCEAHFDTAESMASNSPPGSKGLLFLPYLSGERAPIWNERARGVWFGLCLSHKADDLLRSVLEGVSLALATILNDLCRCMGKRPSIIKVIGGGVRNRLWTDILVASFGIPIELQTHLGEATARGAFLAAAKGAGIISDFDQWQRLSAPTSIHYPDGKLSATYEALKPIFGQLYRCLEKTYDDLDALRFRLQVEGD